MALWFSLSEDKVAPGFPNFAKGYWPKNRSLPRCESGASFSLPPVVMEGCDYEVFLSFRGPDTRKGITDHLYTRLIEAGVRTYKDNEDLRIGEEIGPELLEAIEQSKISIPILSKSYASSKWCLMELTKMVECRKKKGQIIMPIFYYVNPSELRHQNGGYGKALPAHKRNKRVDNETIGKWRAALSEVGRLKGWHTSDVSNSYEGQLVKQVVTKVLSELKKDYLVVCDPLVCIDDRVKKVLGMIGSDKDDVKIVGIHGMGGIGKSILAKVVYNQLSREFAYTCFLGDVRNASNMKGLVCLQNRLISDLSNQTLPSVDCVERGMGTIEERFSSKKVLILLDNVDEKSQLTALLGRRCCFGHGSRILITTRNAMVLRAFEVKLTYLVDAMDSHRSLQLFSKHAFRRDHPPIEKLEQSREIVKIAQGLPLLLEVMGSTLSLYGQRKEMWDDYLMKLKNGDIKVIKSNLMISYESLDHNQREIFLDIACLFDGYDKSTVIYMWEDCGLCPTEGLETLQLMSLIKIREDNKLWMHDQLKDLGREIVFQESQGELDKRSRLWNHKNSLDILRKEKRNEKLEALCLKFEEWSEYRFTLEGFAALPNLRFLDVDSHPLAYDDADGFLSQATLLWHNLTTSPMDFWLGDQLLPNLRWLSWHNFPQRILKIRKFSVCNLVVLDFSRSKITHDWDGWKHIKRAEKLKVLNLSGCEHLVKTPDFSGFFKLERLILEECERLIEIDSSIGLLEHLVFLNLSFCHELYHLPQALGELPALTELLLDGTSIREIPDWWGTENPKNPFVLSPSAPIDLLLGRTSIRENPDWCSPENLENRLVQISPSAKAGDSANCLTSLLKLSLDHTEITHLPNSIGALTNLESLSLNGCLEIGRLPHSINELRSLTQLDLLETGITELPNSMESLENLKELNLSSTRASRCVSALPKLPVSLTSLTIIHPNLITIPDLSCLINLKRLLLWMGVSDISSPSEWVQLQDPEPWWIGRLSKLEVLTLRIPRMTNLSPELGALPHLKSLHLYGCHALGCIPQIPSSVSKLHVVNCPSLTTLDISNLKSLSELYVIATPVVDLSGREMLDNLLAWKIETSEDYDDPEMDDNLKRTLFQQHGYSKFL